MALPTWGVAVIVIYCLLQIPAVILIGRYAEVEAGDLSTPPMRSYWQEESTPKQAGVRCERCGHRNDPDFSRCRHCVAPL